MHCVFPTLTACQPGAGCLLSLNAFPGALASGLTCACLWSRPHPLQGYCRGLALSSLHASSWDGGWAKFDVPLGAFAWQQNRDSNSQFWGCGGPVSAWDVNEVRVANSWQEKTGMANNPRLLVQRKQCSFAAP
jgi:hypothetical protein